MQINFRDLRNNQDPDDVCVCRILRDRYRGHCVVKNKFVLYKRRGLSRVFELFIEPSLRNYTAAELGGRLMLDLAETVMAGGEIRISRDPLINFEFIASNVALEEVAHLLALGLNHDNVVDLHARVTLENEPFLGVSTVADLIHRYLPKNGNS